MIDYEEALCEVSDVLRAHNKVVGGISHQEACELILEAMRPKGKWELYQYQESRKKDWYCTACATIVKKPLEKKYVFCPYCGADMRGDV